MGIAVVVVIGKDAVAPGAFPAVGGEDRFGGHCRIAGVGLDPQQVVGGGLAQDTLFVVFGDRTGGPADGGDRAVCRGGSGALVSGEGFLIAHSDLDKVFSGEQPDIYLKPNDVVRVGTNAFAPFLALTRIWVRPVQAIVSVTAHRSPLARRASDHLPLRAVIDVRQFKRRSVVR